MTRGRKAAVARMLGDIRNEVRLTRQWTRRNALDSRIMEAMAKVPRDAFVPEALKGAAFDNGPLPIGHGQTISQPFIVALMTDLLAPQPDDKVLEVGTGSGYQTAVLARLCATVYSIDLVPQLVDAAAGRLADMDYDNVRTMTGNGYRGWPEQAPFDGIIVTAAAPFIPNALIDQLKPGGRLVIPLGFPHERQELMLLSKHLDGEIETRSILAVAFVPLIDQPVATPE